MKSENKTLDMCSGSLTKKILIFTIPLMLSGLLQLLYNAADVIVVGRYAGQEALAAVGTTGALINLILNLFIGLSGGVSVAMARVVGAKNDKEIHNVVHTAISISIIAGAFLTVVGIILSEYMLKLISVPTEILPQAVSYMHMIFYGMIPSMVFNFGSAVLRSKGDTKRPLYVVSVSGIINVILNVYFVTEFKMGAAGVGLATTIAQTVSAVLLLWILTRQTDSSKLIFHRLKININQLIFIVKIGVPAGIQGIVFSLSNIIVQSGINSFGSACMAGCAAAGNIEGFMFTALDSFSQSAMTFVSQNIGAKKYARINKVTLTSLMYVAVLGILIAFISCFCGEFLMKIYCPTDPDAVNIGCLRLKILGISYILCGFQSVLCSVLRGMGASFSGMVATILGICGTRIVWVYTIFKQIGTLESLLVSYPISWAGTAIIFFVMYLIAKRSFKFDTDVLTAHSI